MMLDFNGWQLRYWLEFPNNERLFREWFVFGGQSAKAFDQYMLFYVFT
jgi:hypothetical protein